MVRIRRWLLLLALAVPGLACERKPVPSTDDTSLDPAAVVSASPSVSSTAQATRADEEAAIIAFIQRSQREGVVGRDPEAFMRIWARDARLIGGRSEQPDRYDHALDYAQFRRSAQLRSKGKADAQLSLEYRDEAVTITGDQATVTWSLTVKWRRTRDGSTGSEDTGERWKLRRTPDGWRVVENRYWPRAATFGGKTFVFDQAHWRKRDEAVVLARDSDDPIELAMALLEAFRLTEALEVARKMTQDGPGNPEAWAWRGRLADRARLAVEALEAYEKLRVIDPKAEVPGWVEHMLAELEKLGR